MENYLGEIRIFGGTFAPVGWLDCSGQLLAVSENEALFMLLGTTYGGDGQTTFALPNLQSRAAVGMGQGPGLSYYSQGQPAGTENVTLLAQQLPAHQHLLQGTIQAVTGGTGVKSPKLALFGDQGNDLFAAAGNAPLAADALTLKVAPAGGNLPHANLQPTQTIRYIIATAGLYPSQQ
ncbi:tail fiber protein [Hymenobacter arcticus]